MKKTIILVIILLVSLNTTFCDNNKNINIYIPNSIDIISHTITKYKNDDIKNI